MAFCGFLKFETAVDVLIGPFIDDTDGKTAETGLTLDVEISKNGQGLVNKNDDTTPVHDAGGTVDGYYNCELDTTDTGTLGIITLVAHAAGFLPVRQDYQVVPAIVYDAMYAAAGTDYLQVDTVQVSGTAQTANDIGADVNEILTDTGTTLDTIVDSILEDTGTTLDDKADQLVAAVITNAAGTDIAADIIAVKAAVDAIGGDATAANQETIIQILTGKWEVTGNQLIMYAADGTTALYTFNLTQDGVATEFNPDKRVPV